MEGVLVALAKGCTFPGSLGRCPGAVLLRSQPGVFPLGLHSIVDASSEAPIHGWVRGVLTWPYYRGAQDTLDLCNE